MKETTELALKLAAQITEASLKNATAYPNESCGKNVADFFETVFAKIHELTKTTP